jgi:hypothetical protein
MPIKTISRYEISSEDAECVLLVELEGGCISITPEGGESVMITTDQAQDLIVVLHKICEENS